MFKIKPYKLGPDFIKAFTPYFCLKTLYEVCTLKIEYHYTLSFAKFLLFVAYLCQIYVKADISVLCF